MRIRPKIGPLPPGVAVAARRSRINDKILVIVSEDMYERPTQRGLLLNMLCDALGRLLDQPPEDHGRVEIRTTRGAVAS